MGLAGVGCRRPPTVEDYLRKELSYVRFGVDLTQEENAVRGVLAQRGLRIVSERRGPGFVALGAQSGDGVRSAVRVVTQRGVVVALDAARDDLFHPESIRLLEAFSPRFGDYLLVGAERVARGLDRGCVELFTLTIDARAEPTPIELGALGSRACVVALEGVQAGLLKASVGWPTLAALVVPTLTLPLEQVEPPLGRGRPQTPRLRLSMDATFVSSERDRLAAALGGAQTFSQRYAVGVAQAALALLGGQGVRAQLSALYQAVGSIAPVGFEAEVLAEAARHIEDGWFDADAPPEESGAMRGADAGTDGATEEDMIIIDPAESTSDEEW